MIDWLADWPTFKIAVLRYKCQHGAAPQYLQSYCELTSTCTGPSSLPSAQTRQLVVHRTRMKYRDRSFAVQGPPIWNLLSCEFQTFHRLYSETNWKLICSTPRNSFAAFADHFIEQIKRMNDWMNDYESVETVVQAVVTSRVDAATRYLLLQRQQSQTNCSLLILYADCCSTSDYALALRSMSVVCHG